MGGPKSGRSRGAPASTSAAGPSAICRRTPSRSRARAAWRRASPPTAAARRPPPRQRWCPSNCRRRRPSAPAVDRPAARRVTGCKSTTPSRSAKRVPPDASALRCGRDAGKAGPVGVPHVIRQQEQEIWALAACDGDSRLRIMPVGRAGAGGPRVQQRAINAMCDLVGTARERVNSHTTHDRAMSAVRSVLAADSIDLFHRFKYVLVPGLAAWALLFVGTSLRARCGTATTCRPTIRHSSSRSHDVGLKMTLSTREPMPVAARDALCSPRSAS